jgi:hypothetical protein
MLFTKVVKESDTDKFHWCIVLFSWSVVSRSLMWNAIIVPDMGTIVKTTRLGGLGGQSMTAETVQVFL